MGRRQGAGDSSKLTLPCADLAVRHWSERVACSYLTGMGWQFLANNYRLRGSEVDLIMQQGRTVVIVEVKQRKSADFGHPAEAIDARKLGRLRAAAQHFATYELKRPNADLRIDAVLLLGTEHNHHVQHLENVA